jgi:uncharacterized protein YybS (DUF2232 family)
MTRGIAVYSATLLFVMLVPFIGPIVIIMTPLPILYQYARLGRMRGLIALAVALAAVYGILGLAGQRVNLFVLLTICLTGVMLAEVLKGRFSLEKTFGLASLTLLFSGIGFVLFHAFRMDTAPWRIVEIYVAGVIRENLRLYEQLNISAEQVGLIRENAAQITAYFTGIFPALALSGAVITVWLNVLAGRSLFHRNGLPFPDFGDLGQWKAPERLVWLLIAAGGMVLAPWESVETIGTNLLIVSCLIYLFQGLSIAAFFFRLKQVPVVVRWLFYLLLVVQQYMAVVVIAFGLFDIWVDFRKRIAGVKDLHV